MNQLWKKLLAWITGPLKKTANDSAQPLKDLVCREIDAAVEDAIRRGEESPEAIQRAIIAALSRRPEIQKLPSVAQAVLSGLIYSYDVSPLVGNLAGRLRTSANSLKQKVQEARF